VAFAESAFRLAKTDEKGVSLEAKLRQAERATKKPHPMLQVFDPPEEVAHLWFWFQDLCQGRTGGFGPSPLSWADIHSWSILTGNELRPWELRMIRALDRSWLKVFSPKPTPAES
jgi:hypothetical protein